ncbi:hypothetical protein D3C72_2056390 [compost metagenome]
MKEGKIFESVSREFEIKTSFVIQSDIAFSFDRKTNRCCGRRNKHNAVCIGEIRTSTSEFPIKLGRARFEVLTIFNIHSDLQSTAFINRECGAVS